MPDHIVTNQTDQWRRQRQADSEAEGGAAAAVPPLAPPPPPPPLPPPPREPAALSATIITTTSPPAVTKKWRRTSNGDDDDGDDLRACNSKGGGGGGGRRRPAASAGLPLLSVDGAGAGGSRFSFGGGRLRRSVGGCVSPPPATPRPRSARAAVRALLRPLMRLPRPLRLPLLILPPLLLLLLLSAVLLLPSKGSDGALSTRTTAAREEAAALATYLYRLADGLAHADLSRGWASAGGALRDVRASPLRPDAAYAREGARALAERLARAPGEAEEERLLRRVVEECARGEDTAIWIDAARGAVVSQPLRGAAGGASGDRATSSNDGPVVRLGPPSSPGPLGALDPAAPCPPLDIALRGQERGVGMCADVALYAIRAGARIVPLPATPEARAAYDAQCGARTARMFLESMYSEFFYGGGGGGGGAGAGGVGGGAPPPPAAAASAPPSPPPPPVLHLHLLNSEHMWARDHALHARIDAFLCKTRFCERLARAHVRRRGLKAAVWYLGHTSGDPTVGTLPAPGDRQGGGGAWPPPVDADEVGLGDVDDDDAAAAGGGARGIERRQAAAHALVRRAGAVHVKGKSGLKHTTQLLECWASRPDLPRLVVVGKVSLDEARRGVGGSPPALRQRNVVFFPTVGGSEEYVESQRREDYGAVRAVAASGGLDSKAFRLLLLRDNATAAAAAAAAEAKEGVRRGAGGAPPARLAAAAKTPGASFGQIRALQARLPLHLCVSEREGFGHYLNEARAAGALVVTTAHAPMDELAPAGSVAAALVRPHRLMSYPEAALGRYARIVALARPRDICEAVDRALALPPREAARRRAGARRAYELGRAEFRARAGDLAGFLHRRAMEASS